MKTIPPSYNMLKLEKIAKTRELNVLLRTKPTVFSATFLYALGYALLIHFGALFIFKISPFKVNYQQSVFPPVRVATELPIQNGVYTTNLHSEEFDSIPSYLLAPLPIAPDFPEVSQILPTIEGESTNLIASSFENSLFLLDELFNDAVDESHSSKMESESFKPLTCHLSGSIAELPIFSNGLSAGLSHKGHGAIRAIIAVQVNQSDGQIFWWQIKEGLNQEQQNVAIEVLKNLQFVPQTTPDIISGEIEIVILPVKSAERNKGSNDD